MGEVAEGATVALKEISIGEFGIADEDGQGVFADGGREC